METTEVCNGVGGSRKVGQLVFQLEGNQGILIVNITMPLSLSHIIACKPRTLRGGGLKKISFLHCGKILNIAISHKPIYWCIQNTHIMVAKYM